MASEGTIIDVGSMHLDVREFILLISNPRPNLLSEIINSSSYLKGQAGPPPLALAVLPCRRR